MNAGRRGVSVRRTAEGLLSSNFLNIPMSDFLKILRERVVVYDGAMGTNIQVHAPTVDDYWGKEGCNELLVLSKPEIIREIHARFFEAGCDVVETDSFG